MSCIFFTGYFGNVGEKPKVGTSLLSMAVLFRKPPISETTAELFNSLTQRDYLQRFNYEGNEEVYASRSNYLISAAGRFHFYEKFFILIKNDYFTLI